MSQAVTEVKGDPYFNGQWLRKATDAEKGIQEANESGFILIWYQLELSSAEPLQEDHLRAALTHLYRKTPNLGACFGTHEGSLWLKRATNPNVDFKILHDVSVEDVRELLRYYSYNTDTGPLFCARLLPQPPSTGIEDLEPSLPNKYQFMFGLHHAIVDGTSNMDIMGFFITLLNDVISNKVVNDDEPLGKYVADEETLRLLTIKKSLLEADHDLKKKVSNAMEFLKNHTPIILKSFPSPTATAGTVSLVEVLDQQTTAKFLQRCRHEKATVNSVFSAMANVAITDILVEDGIQQDSYLIQNLHTVNLRRYWETVTRKTLGLHIGYPLMMNTETPRNLEGKFWDYCRSLNQNLRHDVESGRILLDLAFKMITPNSKETSHENVVYEGDFITSNLGEITAAVTEGGEHVRITNVIRGTTLDNFPFPILLNLHTFRGIFTMIFEYKPAAVTASVAERICSQIMKRLRELIE